MQKVIKQYTVGEDKFLALKGIDMKVQKGEFVSIMGPSGSGKSTMLHILGCLDIPSHGKYLLDGKNIAKLSDDELSKIRNEKIGFVFQSFNLLPKFTVLDNVLLPFLYSPIKNGVRKKIAMEVLEKVGLADKARNMPNQISGGQKQRVAIARSLVMNPSIILADEPTGNLDTKTGDQVMEVVEKVHKEGATIILITHEPEIGAYADRIVNIRDGLVVD